MQYRKDDRPVLKVPPKKYYKEKATYGIGWNVFDPVGALLCWISDATVADRVLEHLNRKNSK
jgi:hypothetical protein